MESKLNKILQEIKSKTSLDVDVYDVLGNLTGSTSPKGCFRFPDYPSERFADGICADAERGVTAFSIHAGGGVTYGVIRGADSVARNYAYMVSSLIETAYARQEENFSRGDSFRSLLLGELRSSDVARFAEKYALAQSPAYVMVLRTQEDRSGEILAFLGNYSDNPCDTAVVMDDVTVAYVKFIENDDYLSCVEFAEMLASSMMEELQFRMYIGTGTVAKSLSDMPSVYAQGVSALKMGMSQNEKASVHSYKEYILVKMIDDIDAETLEEYLGILVEPGAKEILEDREMVATAEEFLNNSLNISETSRYLYMHRNTLMYRLDKIEKNMGLNIRNFSDAVTFRIVMLLYRKLKKM